MSTVAFHTFGCKLNFSETSTISRMFKENGYQRTTITNNPDKVIINTCSVTENANKECQYLVRKVLKKNPNAKIVIMGCYAQLKPKEIEAIDKITLRINDILSGLFRGIGIKLVDFKIEYGISWNKDTEEKEIVLADEISPDTCRLWDVKTEKKLDKDRFRKDLGDLIPAYTEVAKRLGILHEQSNVSAVNVTKLSSIKKKSK